MRRLTLKTRSCFLVLLTATLSAQPVVGSAAEQTTTVGPFSVKLSDGMATNLRYHLALPTNSVYRSLSNVPPPRPPRALNVAPHAASAPPWSFYPADLENQDRAAVIKAAVSHNIYVDCEASCWGDPDGFLRNFAISSFVHLIDQYVGETGPNRYTVGAAESVNPNIYGGRIDNNEILALVDAASQKYGSGYGQIYHVFLPQGMDTCTFESDQCYSPDNKSTFQFCAYHSSVDLPGGRHVLYTIEPYQNIDTCASPSSIGSTALENSTDSSLSHELFETITDPDIDAWRAVAQVVSGQEIADLCDARNFPIVLGARTYSIQLEYSNANHSCMGGEAHSP